MSSIVVLKPEIGSTIHLNAAGLDCAQRKLISDCLEVYASTKPKGINEHSAAVDGVVELLRERGVLTDAVETELRARCETRYCGDRPTIRCSRH